MRHEQISSTRCKQIEFQLDDCSIFMFIVKIYMLGNKKNVSKQHWQSYVVAAAAAAETHQRNRNKIVKNKYVNTRIELNRRTDERTDTHTGQVYSRAKYTR